MSGTSVVKFVALVVACALQGQEQFVEAGTVDGTIVAMNGLVNTISNIAQYLGVIAETEGEDEVDGFVPPSPPLPDIDGLNVVLTDWINNKDWINQRTFQQGIKQLNGENDERQKDIENLLSWANQKETFKSIDENIDTATLRRRLELVLEAFKVSSEEENKFTEKLNQIELPTQEALRNAINAMLGKEPTENRTAEEIIEAVHHHTRVMSDACRYYITRILKKDTAQVTANAADTNTSAFRKRKSVKTKRKEPKKTKGKKKSKQSKKHKSKNLKRGQHTL